MNKRKGIFDFNVKVRKLLEKPSSIRPNAHWLAEKRNPVLLSNFVTIIDTLSMITRQIEIKSR